MIIQLIITLAVGALAGWIATNLVRGQGLGLPFNIVIGVIGGVIGGFVLPRIGISIGGGILAALLTGTLGAIILVFAAIGLQRIGVIPRRMDR